MQVLKLDQPMSSFLQFISHAYPLSYVQDKSQSHRTTEELLPRKCRFSSWTWRYKISFVRITNPITIGGGVATAKIHFSCILMEFWTGQTLILQDNQCVNSHKDEDSAVRLGDAKILLSGSLSLSWMRDSRWDKHSRVMWNEFQQGEHLHQW
jgi:hypothetical protein